MKTSIATEKFRVRPDENVQLSEWPTTVKPFCKSKKQYQKLLGEHVEELSSLQRIHYASNRYALLLIFQGMDAAGKDGAIRHVMPGVNPQGCQVFSFKQPSAEELEHETRDLRVSANKRKGNLYDQYEREQFSPKGIQPQGAGSGDPSRRRDRSGIASRDGATGKSSYSGDTEWQDVGTRC